MFRCILSGLGFSIVCTLGYVKYRRETSPIKRLDLKLAGIDIPSIKFKRGFFLDIIQYEDQRYGYQTKNDSIYKELCCPQVTMKAITKYQVFVNGQEILPKD